MESERYWLGVDLGTCVTSAATRSMTSTSMLTLGHHSHDMPSVVAITEDAVLVGEPAHRRGRTDPGSVAREFKRRMGDPTPLVLSGRSVSPEWLTAQLLEHVLSCAEEQRGAPPQGVVLSYPATWGGSRLDRLGDAAASAGIVAVEFISEPEAAARFAAESERLAVGALAAVFDLGGGTFDTALLRREAASAYRLIGKAVGLERLGGVDLDEALFGHILAVLDLEVSALPETAPVMAAMSQLRDDVVAAKETLSFDSSTVVPVLVEGHQTQVRLTRVEFESLARPYIDKAVDTVELAIADAGLTPEEVDVIVPVGGTSRVPLVAERLASRLGIEIASSANPRHAVALGALGAPGLGSLDEPPTTEQPDRSMPLEPPIVISSPPWAGTPTSSPSPVATPSASTPADIEGLDGASSSARSRRRLLLLAVALVVSIGLGGLGGLRALGDTADSSRSFDLDVSASKEASPTVPPTDPDLTDSPSVLPSAVDELPAEGFELVGALQADKVWKFLPFLLNDPGPSGLPQRRWANQFDLLDQAPVAHSGVIVINQPARSSGARLGRIHGLEASGGQVGWTHESNSIVHSYFVGDGGVVLVATQAEAVSPDRIVLGDVTATLLDLETGEPRARLVISPPSADPERDVFVEAKLAGGVLVTTWQRRSELISSAYDLSAAEQLWEERDPAPERQGFGADLGSAIDDQTYVVFGDGALIARDLRTGAFLWSTADVNAASVRAARDGVLVLSSTTGRTDLVGRDMRTGDLLWTVYNRLGQTYAADADRLFVLDQSASLLYAVTLRGGSMLWETAVELPDILAIASMGVGDDDALYITTSNGDLMLLDARDGEQRWSLSVEPVGGIPWLMTAGAMLLTYADERITAYG